MNTRQLLCALDSDPAMKDFHREVYAKDQFLKANLMDKGIYICNNGPSYESGNFLLIHQKFTSLTVLQKIQELITLNESLKQCRNRL